MRISNSKSLTAASVLTAGLASLCCMGPLVAAATGIGAFGAGAAIENLLPYMLATSGALLGTALYLAGRRGAREKCGDGSCAVSPGKRRQRALLWIFAALAVSLGAFPYYSGLFWSGTTAFHSTGASTATVAGMADVVLDVEGMTCESCAAGAQAKLGSKTGVSSAKVDFRSKVARVVYDPSQVSVEQLTESIAELGFRAVPRTSHRETND